MPAEGPEPANEPDSTQNHMGGTVAAISRADRGGIRRSGRLGWAFRVNCSSAPGAGEQVQIAASYRSRLPLRESTQTDISIATVSPARIIAWRRLAASRSPLFRCSSPAFAGLFFVCDVP